MQKEKFGVGMPADTVSLFQKRAQINLNETVETVGESPIGEKAGPQEVASAGEVAKPSVVVKTEPKKSKKAVVAEPVSSLTVSFIMSVDDDQFITRYTTFRKETDRRFKKKDTMHEALDLLRKKYEKELRKEN